MAWPVLAAQFLKKWVAQYNWSTEKCYISIFVLVTIFLIYLTAVYNLCLAKVWLTQGLTVTRYILRSRCLWLMDLVIIQIIRIFLDYHVAWMWYLLWQFECCSWLFSSYFIIRIFVKWLWKAQSAKETFVSEMRLWLNFCEACIQFSSTQHTGRSGWYSYKSILEGWSFWDNCWIL